MSAWAVPLAALQGFGTTTVVLLPLALASHYMGYLVLPVLVPHRRRRRHRTWKRWGAAFTRWMAALALLALCGLLTAVLALLVLDETNLTWLGVGLLICVVLGLASCHLVLMVKAARRGARLYAHRTWRTTYREARHFWQLLTIAMPLRAGDFYWVVVVFFPALAYTGYVAADTRRSLQGSLSISEQWAFYAGVIILLGLAGMLLWLLERVTPQLTLARWAAEFADKPAGSVGRSPTGTKVSALLQTWVRRRVRRVPPSLKDDYLKTSSKLMEAQRVAELKKQTRPKFDRALREALQYSARLANNKNAYESLQMVDSWLAGQGQSDISAPPLKLRRMPSIQGVGEVTEVVSRVKDLVVWVVVLIVAVAAGLSLTEIIEKLK